MREKPGPDVAVRAISPVREAPMQAQIDAISSSICRKTPPILGSSWAMVSMISELGVMGYPAKNRTPASSAPSAQALLPCTSRLLRSTFSAGYGYGARVPCSTHPEEIRTTWRSKEHWLVRPQVLPLSAEELPQHDLCSRSPKLHHRV